MFKRKADTLTAISSSEATKRLKRDSSETSKAQPTSNLLDSDSSSGIDNESEPGGALLEETDLKINQEYAKRFEHNKKREELHKLEDKYQKVQKSSHGQYGDKYDEDEDSSSDEDEDDEGFLATEDLDAQISATLQAIREKDPRVYDEKVTFYAPIDEDKDEEVAVPEEKPMYLRDYHRRNLLKGDIGPEDDENPLAPRTFAEEQEDLKKTIVKEMHEAATVDTGSSKDEHDREDDEFLKPKAKPQVLQHGVHPSRASKVGVDVAVADKDPETFLSNFMSARAWIPKGGARFQPLESDDEEEEERAERFEVAYNLRFEDPKGSNEVLKSYARDVVAAKSVRREERKSRNKHREADREKKETERRQREEEKARLRKLKIEEMEQKLQKVKMAAGLKGQPLGDEEWTKFFDEGWDDGKWEEEMSKRFGEEYYAEQEVASEEEGDQPKANGPTKRRLKKPRWADDIDINDIVPEFDEELSNERPVITLSEPESERDDEESGASRKKPKSTKDRQQEKLDQRKTARLERKRIEGLVDNQLGMDDAILPESKSRSRFRYRETSPTSFGLTARDILMAPDASLNQFAGLKKMATFRDAEKKRKDKKRLGKKARLREWRRETFGDENGPEIILGGGAAASGGGNGVDAVEGKRRRRRAKRKEGHSAE